MDRISWSIWQSKWYIQMKQTNDFFKVLYTKCWNKRIQFINWCEKFFDTPIKNKEETCGKTIKMERNNDYTTGNLLNYELGRFDRENGVTISLSLKN